MMRIITLLIALFGVAACSTVPTPKSPREWLASAEIIYTGAITSASIAYDRGALSQRQAERFAVTFQSTQLSLRSAALVITNPNSTDDELEIALASIRASIAALEQVQRQLRNNRVKELRIE